MNAIFEKFAPNWTNNP